MSNENKQIKPDCPLIGQDGNIFNLVGIAAITLKIIGLSEQASEMTSRVLNSGSYEEALGICHAADGWGEGFGQHPVTLGKEKIYISFWNSDDRYFLKPESEVFPEQDMNLNIGGI